jgi:hypothetical protein
MQYFEPKLLDVMIIIIYGTRVKDIIDGITKTGMGSRYHSCEIFQSYLYL